MTKKIELTNENQKKSKEYYEKIKNLLEVSEQYRNRKREAEINLEKLKEKLVDINNQIVMELDGKKLDKLAAERKSLRTEIEDLKDLVSVDISELMRSKWVELKRDDVVAESSLEFKKFNSIILEEMEKAEKAHELKMEELESLRENHLHNKATTFSQALLKMLAK